MNGFQLGSVMIPFIAKKNRLSINLKENQNKCLEIRGGG